MEYGIEYRRQGIAVNVTEISEEKHRADKFNSKGDENYFHY